ncbi:hypothetical protein [uncultured Vibrio sp.]|uniref:hypothetical protein n=1 Tax=uncultured Vibrio sp. TaxID=114054 RepID=UPI002602F2A2|nr:hypothetical protein [uncultured Vibrio sp.]
MAAQSTFGASQRLLENTPVFISQVAEQAGFKSESVFRKYFKSAFDVAPHLQAVKAHLNWQDCVRHKEFIEMRSNG